MLVFNARFLEIAAPERAKPMTPKQYALSLGVPIERIREETRDGQLYTVASFIEDFAGLGHGLVQSLKRRHFLAQAGWTSGPGLHEMQVDTPTICNNHP